MSDEILPENEFTAGDNFFGQMLEAGVADKRFIREIVEMFIEEGQTSLNNIAEAIENENIDHVRLNAHKLKSSFLMFDMHDEHSIAVQLEEIDLHNLNEASRLFSILQAKCEENFQKLQRKYQQD